MIRNKIRVNDVWSLGIADTLLVYTMLAPIIFLVIGMHLNLVPNIIRTLIVLIGPGLVAGVIYLKIYGFRVLIRNKWIILCMLIFTLIYIFSCIKRLDVETTRESLKFFMGWCVFGFCMGTISNMSISRSQRFYIIWLVFIIGLLIYATYHQWPKLTRKFELDGINEAQIGTMIYFFAICILCYFGITRNLLTRIIIIALFLACFILAFYSGTRTAFFGFIIIFAIYLLFYSHINRKKLYPIAVACLLIIAFIILLPNLNRIVKKSHTKTLKQVSNIINYLKSDDPAFNNAIARIQIWKNALNEFKKKPIFGSGVGLTYHAKGLNKDYVHPHNIILELLAETGVVGFGAFVVLFSLITIRAASNYKKLEPENRMTFLFFPLSLLFFFLYSSLHTDLSTEYFKWYFAGMITGFDV